MKSKKTKKQKVELELLQPYFCEEIQYHNMIYLGTHRRNNEKHAFLVECSPGTGWDGRVMFSFDELLDCRNYELIQQKFNFKFVDLRNYDGELIGQKGVYDWVIFWYYEDEIEFKSMKRMKLIDKLNNIVNR